MNAASLEGGWGPASGFRINLQPNSQFRPSAKLFEPPVGMKPAAWRNSARLQVFKEIMPLYQFAIAGRKVIDTLRVVLPDPEAARTHAFDLATNIGKHTLETPANAVRVIDEKGFVLFRVPIRRSVKSDSTLGPDDSLLWLPRPSA